MIELMHTDKIYYTIRHPSTPDGMRTPTVDRKLALIDPTIPTRASLNECLMVPFEPIPLGTVGLLEVIYEGVTYHAQLG